MADTIELAGDLGDLHLTLDEIHDPLRGLAGRDAARAETAGDASSPGFRAEGCGGCGGCGHCEGCHHCGGCGGCGHCEGCHHCGGCARR